MTIPRSLALLLILQIYSNSVFAKDLKTSDVNVINEPSVNVTNTTLAVEGTVEVSNLPGSVPARFQLVGFSTSIMKGDAGVLGFAQACQQQYPNSRMCTSEEVMNTVSVPTLPVVETWAWVRPVLNGPSYEGPTSAQTLYDASGIGPANMPNSVSVLLNCVGWSTGTSGNLGLVVNQNGGFRTKGCSTPKPVACCAVMP